MDGGLQTYEELTGGHGRRVVYRSTRYNPASVFGGRVPRAIFKDTIAGIEDLSVSGVALSLASGSDVPFGVGEFVNLSLDYDGTVLLEMPCVTRRVAERGEDVVVGLSFYGDLLDIPQLSDRARHLNVAAQAQRSRCTEEVLVSLEYRGFCADVLMLLRKYRNLSTGDAGQETVFNACKEPFLREWRGLNARGNTLVRSCSNEAQMAAERSYAFELLRPEFEIADLWKALVSFGEAGLTVQDIASARALGDRAKAPAYERLLDSAAADALAVFDTRMESLVDCISGQAARAEPGSTLRVVSFAGGEARELRDLHEAVRGLDVSVEVNVVDWREALLQASYSAQRSLSAGNVKVRHTLVSRDALAGSVIPALAENNDIIYSSAVCDGLDDAGFADHVAALERYVRPSGSVLLTGLTDDDRCPRWVLEHVAGIHLFYRDADDVRRLLEQKTDRTVSYAQGPESGVLCLQGAYAE